MNFLYRLLYTAYLKHLHKSSEEELTITPRVRGVSEVLRLKKVTFPYRYYVVDNFLEERVAEDISNYINELLSAKDRTFSYFDIYNLYAHRIKNTERLSLDVFLSYEFKKLIEQLFSKKLSHYTEILFHNNVPITEDKYIHDDYTNVVFQKQGDVTGLKSATPAEGFGPFVNHEITVEDQSLEVKKRAVTALLYLNKNWKPGLGGETGIFYKGEDYIELSCIAPIFNRLVIFEVSKDSHHNYKKSSLKNRNSISQWFYV